MTQATPSASTPNGKVTLQLSNDPGAIAFARMVVRQVLPPLDEVQDPLFFGALTEILTNAIEEHVRRELSNDVEMFIFTGPGARLVVSDSGAGFDAESDPPSSIDTGLGLMITKAVVPGMQIHSGPDGTTVTLPYPTPSP